MPFIPKWVRSARLQVGTKSSGLSARTRCGQVVSVLPYLVSVADTGTGELQFFGYFFDEELFCPATGPLFTADPGPPDGEDSVPTPAGAPERPAG